MSNTQKTSRLKTLINSPELCVVPGVYDALLARCVEQAGFDAVYMSGAGVTQSSLGAPDLGLLSFSEMLDKAWKIADSTNLPLIADADSGYGNALNVMRTVKQYEMAGVAACHIEDQELPKRCGHFAGKTLIPLDEMLGKLRAALDARTDTNFQIIARTDARSVLGLDAAIERAQAFAEEGVDMIFLESPRSEEELQQVGSTIHKPLLANMVEGGLTPLVEPNQLQSWGFSIALHPGAIARFITCQLQGFLKQFKQSQTTIPFLEEMLDFKAQNKIVGLDDWLALDAHYSKPKQ